MAWLIVLDGGSVSIESDDPRGLIEDIEALAPFVEFGNAVEAAGLTFESGVSDDENGDEKAVFMLGMELLTDRYLGRGEVASIGAKLSELDRIQADRFLDELDALLEGVGHATVRVSGLVINHFD